MNLVIQSAIAAIHRTIVRPHPELGRRLKREDPVWTRAATPALHTGLDSCAAVTEGTEAQGVSAYRRSARMRTVFVLSGAVVRTVTCCPA